LGSEILEIKKTKLIDLLPISFRFFLNCGNVFISVKNTWVWSDGSDWDYEDWAPNQPDDSNGGEDCVYLWREFGQFADGNCSDEFPYVCKI
jgi:hypothetical protein